MVIVFRDQIAEFAASFMHRRAGLYLLVFPELLTNASSFCNMLQIQISKLLKMAFEDVRSYLLDATLLCIFEKMGMVVKQDFYVRKLNSFTTTVRIAAFTLPFSKSPALVVLLNIVALALV